jgi:uncharacterized membrane protein YbhN (UPF0104 family)
MDDASVRSLRGGEEVPILEHEGLARSVRIESVWEPMSGAINVTDPDNREGVRLNPRRWSALALLGTAFFMVILDGTIVYVALPQIADDLGFSTSRSRLSRPLALGVHRSRSAAPA